MVSPFHRVKRPPGLRKVCRRSGGRSIRNGSLGFCLCLAWCLSLITYLSSRVPRYLGIGIEPPKLGSRITLIPFPPNIGAVISKAITF